MSHPANVEVLVNTYTCMYISMSYREIYYKRFLWKQGTVFIRGSNTLPMQLQVSKNNNNKHDTNRSKATYRMNYRYNLGFCYIDCSHGWVGKTVGIKKTKEGVPMV